MSKVKLEIFVDRYICDELADMRQMNETRDYSGLSASIERAQKHANAMETAIWAYREILDNMLRADVKELGSTLLIEEISKQLDKFRKLREGK